MDVVPSTPACAPHEADHIMKFDLLTSPSLQFVHMRKARFEPVAVVNLDRQAET